MLPAVPKCASGRVRGLGGPKFAAALALGCLLADAQAGVARAADLVATYSAYWAGLPAGQIRLQISDAAGTYRDKIEIPQRRAAAPLHPFQRNCRGVRTYRFGSRT